jgi:hypothetical protein
MLVIYFAPAVFAHEGGKETVAKVTVESLSGEHPAVESTTHKKLSDAEKDAVIDSDVATIHRDVSRATTLFVIEAVAIALGVAGLAFVYLRRPKTGVSG